MKPINVVHALVFVFFAMPMKSEAGLKWVDVGINGLTCSLCTQSVDRSLSRLDFVDSVVMSLEKTEGRIYLKREAEVDLRKIVKAVVNAGFSVRFLQVEFDFKDVIVSEDGSFTYQGQKYRWIQYKEGFAKGSVSLKLVDEGFLPRKESAQLKKKLGLSSDSSSKEIIHVIQE